MLHVILIFLNYIDFMTVIVGMYTTLDIEDLVEVNQAELLRKQWHPGRRIFEALQRRFAVPQAYSQSVHVLTNEPVFRGNTHCQQTHK